MRAWQAQDRGRGVRRAGGRKSSIQPCLLPAAFSPLREPPCSGVCEVVGVVAGRREGGRWWQAQAGR